MAEGEKQAESGGGGSWWGNWLATAKQQTESLLEVVSNDLTEFTNTMQNDTKKVVDKTKETIQKTAAEKGEGSTTDRMKQGFQSLMGGITKILTVEPEDTSPPRSKVTQPTHGIFDRSQARLRAVQVDTGTYLDEPSGPPEKYAEWLKTFDLDNHKGKISDLLVSMVEVRSLYTTLVPSEVSHQDFWRRYFYKIHQLQVDEARKKALMQRAEKAHIKEESISWDEEEWSGDEDQGSPKPQKQPQTPSDASSRLSADTDADNAPDTSGVDQTATTADASERLKADSPDQSKDTVNKSEQDGTTCIKEATSQDSDVIKQSTDSEKCVDTAQEITKNTDDAAKTDSDKDVAQQSNQDSGELLGTVEKKTANVSEEDTTVKQKPVEQAHPQDSDNDDRRRDHKKECDKTDTVSDVKSDSKELKTKVKGDMVHVGDRVSPSSESSGNKESSNDDWEEDFADVDVTQDDLEAASRLAQKMDLSAKDFSTITGDDEDWENWD